MSSRWHAVGGGGAFLSWNLLKVRRTSPPLFLKFERIPRARVAILLLSEQEKLFHSFVRIFIIGKSILSFSKHFLISSIHFIDLLTSF